MIMVQRLIRFRDKYFRREAWRRWWRSPHSEVFRFEWNWFRNSYLRKKSIRFFILLILFLNICSSLFMLSFQGNIVEFAWLISMLGMGSWLLMMVLILDVMHRRFTLYFGPQTITDLYLSRLKPRQLWPPLLVSPFLLFALIHTINFSFQLFMNLLVSIGVMDMGIMVNVEPSLGGSIRAHQIASLLTSWLDLLVEFVGVLTVLAIVAWHCALRPGMVHLLFRLIFSYIILTIIIGGIAVLPVQIFLTQWLQPGENSGGMIRTIASVVGTALIQRVLMLLIYGLIWNSTLRRLRGPKFHKKYLVALGKASG